LASDSQLPPNFPRHVAIIMDGNGRWARQRMLPRLEGHRQGAKAVRRSVEFCRRNGIAYLTLYAFSTENWQRPQGEVSGLMRLLSQFLESELDELHAQDICLKTIGDIGKLPDKLVHKVTAAKDMTRGNRSMVLTIALSYGGRREILDAALKVARSLVRGELRDKDITEEIFSKFLDTRDTPDPDLLIRTGGEVRISNFLLWQSAYAELYFTPTLWPEFDDNEFMKAIDDYRSRQRRFGMTSEQIDP